MVLIFFLHGVIVGSCYTSYMKRYLQFSIVVNTFRSPSCLKIWCFVQDIRYVHWVLVQLKLSIKERNTGLKRLRMCMCMCMHLGCQYQVATKECKLRCFKGVKEIRSVTRIFQCRGSLCVKQRVRAKLSCRSPRYVLLEVTKKKLMKGGHRISLPPPILHPWILDKAPRQNGKSTQLNKFWVRKVLDFPFPSDWVWIFQLCLQILRDWLIFHEFRQILRG